MSKNVRKKLLEVQGKTATIVPRTGEGDSFLADVKFISKAEDTVELMHICPSGRERPEIWSIDRIEDVIEI